MISFKFEIQTLLSTMRRFIEYKSAVNATNLVDGGALIPGHVVCNLAANMSSKRRVH